LKRLSPKPEVNGLTVKRKSDDRSSRFPLQAPIARSEKLMDNLDAKAGGEREMELVEALKPFAELAEYIAVERPSYDRDAMEVQIEKWPYSLSVEWLRTARRLVLTYGDHLSSTIVDTHPKDGDAKQGSARE
jgi:hypothetical protein